MLFLLANFRYTFYFPTVLFSLKLIHVCISVPMVVCGKCLICHPPKANIASCCVVSLASGGSLFHCVRHVVHIQFFKLFESSLYSLAIRPAHAMWYHLLDDKRCLYDYL